jgi:hypothetical protein
MAAVAQFCEANNYQCGNADEDTAEDDIHPNFVRLVSAPVVCAGPGRVMLIDADLRRTFEPCRSGD